MKKLLNLPVSRRSIVFLALLIAIDLAFIFIHGIHRSTDWLQDPNFSMTQDRGYAEIFQYFKTFLIALGLGLLAFWKRSRIYTAWVCIFSYILLDDSLQLHERLGNILQNSLGFASTAYLRGQDFGELTVFAVFGVLFLALLVATYRAERNYSNRKASVRLFILLVLFALCGGLADMMHYILAAFSTPQSVLRLMTLLEDGGELIVMSLIAWFVCLLLEKRSQPIYPVYSRLLSGRGQHL